jgi:RNA polymerase sigma-70 factor (ECF subfamily)
MDRVKAARKGKLPAFLSLFDEHHAVLYRFAWRLTRSAADAEDIVQECFLALLRPDCNYDPAGAPLRVYLLGAVRNQAYKRLRSREEVGIAHDPVSNASPESDAARSQMEALVARAVSELPETQREILILAHFEQLPLAEIAGVVGIELGAVKSRLQRARAALKESLSVYAPGKE